VPLVVRYEGPLCVPIVLCDQCVNEIGSAADGNYQWLWQDGPARMYFTHKACCRAFEKRHGGLWGAMALELLPAYLVNKILGSTRHQPTRLATPLYCKYVALTYKD
jgi:hypothetical protein